MKTKIATDLKTKAMELINLKEKEMIPLTHDEKVYYEKCRHCHIYEKRFCTDKNKKSEYKINHKVRDHCHYTGKFEVLHIIFVIYDTRHKEKFR